MISFYLSSVIVWMIIIFCIIMLYSKQIQARYSKYLKVKTSKVKALFSLFVLSAVPILRILIAISIILVANCGEEDYNGIIAKMDEAYNEQR